MTDLVRGLKEANRQMQEEHIAYVLKGIVKVGTQHNYIFFIYQAPYMYISLRTVLATPGFLQISSRILSLTF